jgi:hypothetical protein
MTSSPSPQTGYVHGGSYTQRNKSGHVKGHDQMLRTAHLGALVNSPFGPCPRGPFVREGPSSCFERRGRPARRAAADGARRPCWRRSFAGRDQFAISRVREQLVASAELTRSGEVGPYPAGI